MLGSRATAEDVFQEVWIKVMQALPRYRPSSGTFRAWLYRIAGNAAIDRMRRDRLRRGPELDAPVAGEEGERAIDRVAADRPSPEAEGTAAEIARDLEHALHALPERQRAAVLLRHRLGMSYREIGSTLSVPDGTAKTLVHRGVHALRERLPHWSDDG